MISNGGSTELQRPDSKNLIEALKDLDTGIQTTTVAGCSKDAITSQLEELQDEVEAV